MADALTLAVPGYQVIRFLGGGARSTIWEVRDGQTGEVFALKRVVKRRAGDWRFLEQTINEYEIGSWLHHPGVRRILGIRRIRRWLQVRQVLLVMEMCQGQTLQARRPESVAEAVGVFCQVAAALAYMNEQGFVHADTKPNNVVVSDGGSAKIIDLGQSCPIGTVKPRIQGTPDFIAPEQVHRRPLDVRTDVFNLGASLYWTLSGHVIPTLRPKEGSPLPASQRIPPVEQFNPRVPESLSKLVSECIEALPASRPDSMNQVLARLSLTARELERSAPGRC